MKARKIIKGWEKIQTCNLDEKISTFNHSIKENNILKNILFT